MKIPSRLTRYPCFETRDPDEGSVRISQQWRHIKIEAGSAQSYYIQLNTASLDLVAMVAARLSPQQIRIESDHRFYFLTLPRLGGGDYTTNRRTFSIGPGEGLLELPGESKQRIRYSMDVELAVCAIPSATFDGEAEKLIGHPPPAPLEVFRTIPPDSSVWRKIEHGMDELDRPDGLFSESPAAGLRWQRMIIAAILEGTPNSWASLIQMAERHHTGPFWHRQRCLLAEAFMDAHLSAAVSLGDIAKAAGCGRRALQDAFAYCNNSTPTQVFRDKRLDAAHQELTHPDPATTVESVALKYGFQHRGRFAYYYAQRFGCLPSITLHFARARRG
jgi:AraC-like DNA-binding protein